MNVQFVEVSGHNLESSQRFLYRLVFYQVFLLSPLQCTVTELQKYVRGCVSSKKLKSQGKAVEVILNSKEKNSEDFYLDFVQEFGLSSLVRKERVYPPSLVQMIGC